MKKLINIFAILLFVFLYGCEKENYRSFEESQVKIEKSNVIFTAAGGTGTIVVATSGQYTATVDQAWCTLSISGNTITVTASSNMSALTRSANVTIKEGEKTNYVPITQMPVYIHLENYGPINCIGKDENFSFPYQSEAPVTMSLDATWVTGYLQDGMVFLQTTQENPNFSESRIAHLTLTAGNNLTSLNVDIVQHGAVTSVDLDPNVDAVANFLNLKNNAGTSSRYKITLLSSRLEKLRSFYTAFYPIFKEFRIEAPRGTYGTSFIVYCEDAGAKYYYWNCTSGLVHINNSKYDALFAFSGNTIVAGWTAPFLSDANYMALQAFFIQADGFSIIQDTGNVFWFRSKADPKDWFKVEPTSW